MKGAFGAELSCCRACGILGTSGASSNNQGAGPLALSCRPGADTLWLLRFLMLLDASALAYSDLGPSCWPSGSFGLLCFRRSDENSKADWMLLCDCCEACPPLARAFSALSLFFLLLNMAPSLDDGCRDPVPCRLCYGGRSANGVGGHYWGGATGWMVMTSIWDGTWLCGSARGLLVGREMDGNSDESEARCMRL